MTNFIPPSFYISAETVTVGRELKLQNSNYRSPFWWSDLWKCKFVRSDRNGGMSKSSKNEAQS